jgi:FMN reductase
MFSYLHAIVSPTGVYAATDDFGARRASEGLSERIGKVADDFARLVQACGPRARRDVFAEELTDMERLLAGWQPRDGGDDVED